MVVLSLRCTYTHTRTCHINNMDATLYKKGSSKARIALLFYSSFDSLTDQLLQYLCVCFCYCICCSVFVLLYCKCVYVSGCVCVLYVCVCICVPWLVPDRLHSSLCPEKTPLWYSDASAILLAPGRALCYLVHVHVHVTSSIQY